MRTGTYKGKTYEILFLGKTRYGERAQLKFINADNKFWVDADLVEEEDSYEEHRRGNECVVCGRRHPWKPCGYYGCSPKNCDECMGGGGFCPG